MYNIHYTIIYYIVQIINGIIFYGFNNYQNPKKIRIETGNRTRRVLFKNTNHFLDVCTKLKNIGFGAIFQLKFKIWRFSIRF